MTADEMRSVDALRERWRRDPEAFWADATRALDWNEPPTQVFDSARGWFADGVCNACWNAVDRHAVHGDGSRPAIVYRSDAGGERLVAYERLWTELQVLGAILRDCGVAASDRVVIVMPPVPEAVFGMLACARIGAVHAAMPADASIHDIAEVIGRTKSKVILAADGHATPHKSRLDEALALSKHHQPSACIVLQRGPASAALKPPRDRDWRTLWEEGVNYAKTSDCIPLAASRPLCFLPDGAVRDHGGSMVALAMAANAILSAGKEPRLADIGTATAVSAIYGSLLCGQAVQLVEGAAASEAPSLSWTMPRSLDEPPSLA